MSLFDKSPLADGDPDLRGWEIRTISGRRLGTVADVLIDGGPDDAIMIDVDLQGRDRHAVVPIRRTQINRETRVILMDSGEFGGVDPASPSSRREAVVDRRPAVDRPTRGQGADDESGLRAGAPEVGGDRRRAERRRFDRMGTDL